MTSEKTFTDLLITNAAKDAERYIAELKVLEGEIKTLIGANAAKKGERESPTQGNCEAPQRCGVSVPAVRGPGKWYSKSILT